MELKLVRSKAVRARSRRRRCSRVRKGRRAPEFEKPLGRALRVRAKSPGKLLEFTLLHGLEGYKARRVLIAGAGKREKFDAAALRKLAGAAVRFLKGKGVDSARLRSGRRRRHARACRRRGRRRHARRLGTGLPENRQDEKNKPIASLTLPFTASRTPTLEAALEKGRIIAEAANLTRDIAVEPPNLLTPLTLADRARRMARGLRTRPSKCSIRTACGSSAWARCSAWRREAPRRRP